MNIKCTKKIKTNKRKGMYAHGVAFSETRWAEIMEEYKKEVEKTRKCTTRRLAEICSISLYTAAKAVKFVKKRKSRFKSKEHPYEG